MVSEEIIIKKKQKKAERMRTYSILMLIWIIAVLDIIYF